MAKIRVEVEKDQCDFCKKGCDYATPCRRCGLLACHDCRERIFVTYNPTSYSSGYGDIFYCIQCNGIMNFEWKDPLFIAYNQVRSLKLESDGFYKNWKARTEIAEKEAERLFELDECKRKGK